MTARPNSLKQLILYLPRSWFALTLSEQKVVIAIIIIFLIGLAARHFQLKNQLPTRYDTPQPLTFTPMESLK